MSFHTFPSLPPTLSKCRKHSQCWGWLNYMAMCSYLSWVGIVATNSMNANPVSIRPSSNFLCTLWPFLRQSCHTQWLLSASFHHQPHTLISHCPSGGPVLDYMVEASTPPIFFPLCVLSGFIKLVFVLFCSPLCCLVRGAYGPMLLTNCFCA